MKHSSSSFLIFILLFLPIFTFSQNTIAFWTFENFTMNPQVGSGSLSLIGGVTHEAGWTRTGIAPGLSLPMGLPEEDELRVGVGFQTLNYPAQGTNARTGGIQVNVSTVGYKNILFSADVRQGGTSANKLVLLYTIDGEKWDRAVTYTTDSRDTWYLRNYNFSNVPGANNNSKFAIRMVTNFDDDITEADIYVPVRGSVDYSPSGPIRYDNIRFRGTPLDTPDDDRFVVAAWDFDNFSKQPSQGGGTLNTIGGITEDWTRTGIYPNLTIVGEGVYDYAAVKDGASLATLDYPALASANKTAGVEFFVNTTDYFNIYVTADMRHGNTSSNNMYVQYTTDGSTWIDAKNFIVNSGDSWFKKDFDFSHIPTVNNNPNFGIRYVTAFDGLTYMPTGGADKEYRTTGPIRYDNIEVRANSFASTYSTTSVNWFKSGTKLVFVQVPQNNIIIYSISGQKVAEYKPAREIEIDLPVSGIYIFRTGHINGKFNW